ncbi:NADH-ubiquinone oxidoreductase [Penicillium argentinense]|uniref:NADH-ubiquinone oxidoreductase n=1 Tax=Penicillium argentinense TaxID=1131581 RepID=A0A9W9JV94_9EURO|nr:NADH-ubiquinone oxidoreductase [Penicillium argentinense]KAJ5082843.1 NADH-ubiquinone oxidoreductase [Penicillium argentinense]
MAHHAEHAADDSYHPKDAISAALKALTITGGIGLVGATAQVTVHKQNMSPLAVVTRFGSTITILGGMGGTYAFVKAASANLREKEDPWNTALGGFSAGALLGLRARTLPAVLGYGAAAATFMAAYDYTEGLFGNSKNKEEDEFERRQKLRKAYQTPAEQTFAELGEGRGIYGANYEERRRERIKEAYGIEVPTSPVPAS